ncbi:MAG TPA: hypothetical protein VJR58_01935 [Vineibacter sp.]|nr:hypothetical protein [Vineibacter sp.]
MVDHLQNAHDSFAAAQGAFNRQGMSLANRTDLPRMLFDLDFKIALVNDGLMQLAFGLTQLTAAIAELHHKKLRRS